MRRRSRNAGMRRMASSPRWARPIAALGTANRIGMARALPRLETIAIGSIYGKQHSAFLKWEDTIQRAGDETTQTPSYLGALAFRKFLSSGGLKHLCQRGDFHPLGVFPFSSAKDPRTPTVNYTRTCHMAPKTSNLSISLGLPMRWASDYAGEEHWDEMAKIASDCVGQVAGARARFKDVPDYKAEVVDLEVYCTTRPPAGGYGVKPIGERLQAQLRATGHPEDRVRWYPSSETPVCEACGSGVPLE